MPSHVPHQPRTVQSLDEDRVEVGGSARDEAVEIVAEMKRQSWRPLLIARGGNEPHGAEVIAAMRSRGLQLIEREWKSPGVPGLMEALQDVGDAEHHQLQCRRNNMWERRTAASCSCSFTDHVHSEDMA